MKVVSLRLSISRRAVRPVSAAFVLLLCVSAAAIAQDPRIEIARRAFAMLDDNGDGKVTFEEFQGKKILAFTARDKNQDNRLSRDEVQITREQFDAIDQNKDGMISGLEFLDSPSGQFETYDLDKNGSIDLQEFINVFVGK
jgi:Ca2+-binding EF-hand superfamily protein